MAHKAEASDWTDLLAETRLALAALRKEDLARLAERAEQMLEATNGAFAEPFNQPARRNLAREHRLLGQLLDATGKNLAVLQRIHNRAGEMDSRWVR